MAPKPQQEQQSCWSYEPEVPTASASGGDRGDQLPTSMELDDPLQADAGAGDNQSWYSRAVQEEE